MRVDAARIFEDTDYAKIRGLCEDIEGWSVVYHKNTSTVWVQQTDSDFHVIRARCEMRDVAASTLYDVLHDADYRHKWDKHMAVSKDIGMLNPNNDLCYYAREIHNKKFTLQYLLYLQSDHEILLCNDHGLILDYPPQKGYVRAMIFKAGYRILTKPEGCELTYVTHSDPRGKLPAWLINRLTRSVAPKVLRKLHKASLAYPAWKKDHKPQWKPWLFPEQMLDMRRISLSECMPRDYSQEIVDESKIGEKEVNVPDED